MRFAGIDPVPVGLAATVLAGVRVRTRYRRIASTNLGHWTLALPLTRASRAVRDRVPAILPSVLVAAGAALTAGIDAPIPPTAGVQPDLALTAGLLLGSVLAVSWPLGRGANYPPSRYRIGAPPTHTTPGFEPLTADLSIAVAARLQPKTLARIVVPALLVLPNGLGPIQVLTLLLAVSGALYLQALIGGLKDTVYGARSWSASLPLDIGRFNGHLRVVVRRRAWASLLLLVPLAATQASLPGVALAVTGVGLTVEWMQARTLRALQR